MYFKYNTKVQPCEMQTKSNNKCKHCSFQTVAGDPVVDGPVILFHRGKKKNQTCISKSFTIS